MPNRVTVEHQILNSLELIKHPVLLNISHLSLSLPLGLSLSPPLSPSLFGLLSSLINNHFTDVKSALKTSRTN